MSLQPSDSQRHINILAMLSCTINPFPTTRIVYRPNISYLKPYVTAVFSSFREWNQSRIGLSILTYEDFTSILFHIIFIRGFITFEGFLKHQVNLNLESFPTYIRLYDIRGLHQVPGILKVSGLSFHFVPYYSFTRLYNISEGFLKHQVGLNLESFPAYIRLYDIRGLHQVPGIPKVGGLSLHFVPYYSYTRLYNIWGLLETPSKPKPGELSRLHQALWHLNASLDAKLTWRAFCRWLLTWRWRHVPPEARRWLYVDDRQWPWQSWR